MPRMHVTSSFQSFSPFFTILKSFSFKVPVLNRLMLSNEHLFGQPGLLFPSTFKPKICPVCSSLRFTCLNQCSLLHPHTESRLFSFNQLRREFLLTRCSFLILHIHKCVALSLCYKFFLSSCIRPQHSGEESIIPLTQLLYN